MKICTMLCATLLTQSFICAMNEEQALITFSDAIVEIPTGSLRQQVESKLNKLSDLSFARYINLTDRKNMNVARVIHAMNFNTHQAHSGDEPWIGWSSVIRNLRESSEIVADLPTGWMSIIAGLSATSFGILLYPTISTIQRLYEDLEGTTDSFSDRSLGDLISMFPLMTATMSNGVVLANTLYTLARKTGPHKGYLRCPTKTLDFKNLLKSLNEKQDLLQEQERLEALIADKQFSDAETRLIDYARKSSLLHDGTMHLGAFKASLQRTYPLSAHQCKGLLIMAHITMLASMLAVIKAEPFELISFLPMLANFSIMSMYLYLLRNTKSCREKSQPDKFDEIIDTIENYQPSTQAHDLPNINQASLLEDV